ncbi:MAG TPA: nucleotide exchange factor GrpE [bacterium]|nr:nucleotide exchange factor GrpE [bacterium]
MAEDDNNSGGPKTEEGRDEAVAAESPPSGSGEQAAGGQGTPEERDLEISDELKQALEEAEAHFGGAARDAAPAAAPAEPEPGDEEFDPNRAPQTIEPPPPPSPKEMEFKMQVLGLRQKCRDAEQEIEKKIKEIKQNRDQAQHIQKQFEAYKARVMKEKADWFNYGHEPILKEILTVVDNLERALAHAGEAADMSAVQEGVALILRQFQAVLEKFGVKPLDPAGECFNPEFHQAMMQVEDDKVPPHTVVQVSQKGYTLKDRLLRPAMVVVSKHSDHYQPEEAARDEAGGCAEAQAAPGPAPAMEDENGDGA